MKIVEVTDDALPKGLEEIENISRYTISKT
jgi:hypothetical protein